MSESESLERWGTVAFSTLFMKRTIGFGRPIYDNYGVFAGFTTSNPCAHEEPWMGKFPPMCTLELSIWYGFVPQIYWPQLPLTQIREIARKNLKLKATQRTIDLIIADLQKFIIANVKA